MKKQILTTFFASIAMAGTMAQTGSVPRLVVGISIDQFRSDYLNAFMSYVAENNFGDKRPSALTQIYVLTRYNPEIAAVVKEEFADWRKVMEDALIKVYGNKVGKKEAEAMVLLIVGTLIANYCDVHTGRISGSIVSSFENLLDS